MQGKGLDFAVYWAYFGQQLYVFRGTDIQRKVANQLLKVALDCKSHSIVGRSEKCPISF